MKQLLSAVTLSLGLAASMAATSTHAAGTIAGTEIINSATVTYGPANNQTVSDPVTATFKVDEVINVNVTALDSGKNVDVNAGDSASVQAYTVSNLGNGNEIFDLKQTPTGDFTPESTRIYYEPVIGGNGTFDGTEDTYTTGTGLPLDPDQEYYIYLVSNIPAAANVGQISTLTFDAISQTAGASTAAIGTILTGQGTDNTDAVVAVLNGTASDAATFTVKAAPSAVVDIDKSIVSVIADVNGTQVTGQYIPGATVKYSVLVTVTSGIAEGLEIIDSLPTDVTFVANTLVQQVDGTGGYIPVPPASGGYDSITHKVSVNFGDRSVGTYEIQLDATIN
ncbi:MAG: hypothetical protein JKY50_07210 [Oleispira sp.]|nr:hypothetical protein [Oleispira sp.]MBL4880464.1 hypothetical protein [Oleispira sp.]